MQQHSEDVPPLIFPRNKQAGGGRCFAVPYSIAALWLTNQLQIVALTSDFSSHISTFQAPRGKYYFRQEDLYLRDLQRAGG